MNNLLSVLNEQLIVQIYIWLFEFSSFQYFAIETF